MRVSLSLHLFKDKKFTFLLLWKTLLKNIKFTIKVSIGKYPIFWNKEKRKHKIS